MHVWDTTLTMSPAPSEFQALQLALAVNKTNLHACLLALAIPRKGAAERQTELNEDELQ